MIDAIRVNVVRGSRAWKSMKVKVLSNYPQKEEAAMKMLLELGVCNPSRLPVMLKPFLALSVIL
jgi:transposase